MTRPIPALDLDENVEDLVERIETKLGQRRARRKGVRRVAGVVAVGLVMVGAFFFLRRETAPLAMQPLTRGDGAVLVANRTLPPESVVPLSDGSNLSLDPDADLRITANEATRFELDLRQGQVTFQVEPSRNRARTWRVRAGDVLVEVTGTRFSVARHPRAVGVSVQHGQVHVSGARVPGKQRILDAGERIEIPTATPPTAEPSPPTATEPVSQGPNAPVVESLPDSTASERNVLHQCDALRRQGKHRAAARLLQGALTEGEPGQESAVLAFTLGRIQLENLGQPRAAARSFVRATQRNLPASLREQAVARGVQAWAQAGERDRAIALATRYLERYPRGPNRNLVLRWLEPQESP